MAVDDTLVFTYNEAGFQLHMYMQATSAKFVKACKKHRQGPFAGPQPEVGH
jgi:hypothetical protein